MKDKFYYWITYGAFLGLLIQSCNISSYQCEEDAGEKVDCYQYFSNGNLDLYGSFCTEGDFPPCECLEEGTGKSLLPLFKYKDQCTGEGQPKYDGLPVNDQGPSTSGDSPTADEPYEFVCALLGFDDVCTEFDTYYFDLAQASDDRDTRAVYVQFSVESLDIENFNYVVSVSNPSVPYSNNLTQFVLSKRSLESPLIRYFEATDCSTDPCPAVVTVRMDLRNITKYPVNSEVVLSSIDRSSLVMKQLATGTFKVKSENLDFKERHFNLAIYKTDQLDMNQYRIGNRYFSEALLSVFGRGKSNIRFTVYDSEKLPEIYMDNALNDLILKTTDFTPTSGTIGRDDVDQAIREWCLQVTENILLRKQNLSSSLPNYGFATEIESITVIDPISGATDFIKTGVASALIADKELGATYHSRPVEDYYNVSLIHRTNNEFFHRDFEPSTQQSIRIDEMVLATFLHEVGHMWSKAGYDSKASNGCLKHTAKCSGLNYYNCLWRTVCVIDRSNPISPNYDPNELGIDRYMLEKIRNPTFCEGHQQIFMNSLKPLE